MTRTFGRMACAIAVLITSATVGQAQTTPRRVLLLYSYEREFSHFTFARLFRPELTRTSSDPIDFVELTAQTVRASATESETEIVDNLEATLGSRPFDLVVAIGGPAANVSQKYKAQLFPRTPVLLTAVDSRFVQNDRLPPNETALTVRNDPRLMIESMLQLLPDTRTILIVVGASRVEQFWLDELRQTLRPFDARVHFVYTNQMSYADILARSASLPPHSAIFYGILSLDAKGVPQMEDQALDALHASANAPMFGLHSHQLGHGIVGGPLLSLDDLSRDAAAIAVRLLHGDAAAEIPPRTLVAGVATYDSRELRRWGIPESRLQAHSVVRYREAPGWLANQGVMAVVIAVVSAQALLVVGLTINLIKRRRAMPRDVPEVTAAEAALARLSRRLIEAHEQERAWIAKAIHDDVGQQLSALTLRLQALGNEDGGAQDEQRGRIRELCEQFSALEREILAISDPLYARLQMLGLVQSARAFCERRCGERGLGLDFRAAALPVDPPHTVALALFRVLQEAVDNVEAHAHATRVTVSLADRDGRIELEIADNGAGFDPAAAIRGTAVGLIAMRERLRAVGGTCAFESRPGAGTRIRARVPV